MSEDKEQAAKNEKASRMQLKQFLLKRKSFLAGVIILGCLLVLGPTVYANLATRSSRHNANEMQTIPSRSVALVLGAGVFPDGTLTPYLKNRVDTAVMLYKAGKVRKILMSGDNSTERYNEPEAMKRYAVGQAVPEGDVVLDSAGFNTYDSCFRAQTIFSVRDILVVTQGYHLSRAVMTCRGLGMQTDGVAAVRTGRDFTVTYIMREYLSTGKAVTQLLTKPQPTVLGPPEPITHRSAIIKSEKGE